MTSTRPEPVPLEQVSYLGQVIAVDDQPLIMVIGGTVTCECFYISERTERLIALTISTKERWPVLDATGSEGMASDPPGVLSSVYVHGSTTQDLEDNRTLEATEIVFTGWRGWDVFAVQCKKGHIDICLIRSP